MWVKKNKVRIKQEKSDNELITNENRLKNAFKILIWTFVIAFFAEIIISLTLGIDYARYNQGPSNVIEFKDIPEYFSEYIFRALIWATGLFIFSFFFPSVFGKGTDPTTVMCDRCFRTKNIDGKEKCNCGGKFDSLENFEWIEEDINSQ